MGTESWRQERGHNEDTRTSSFLPPHPWGHRFAGGKACEAGRKCRRVYFRDILRCEREIQTAWDDCSHMSNLNDILKCISDLLATTDCQHCLCDVIPQLCSLI